MFEQLKGRYVFRIAAAYAVSAWVLLQILDVLIEPLNLPSTIITATLIVLVLGFPIALAIALWLKSDDDSSESLPETGATPRNLVETVLLALLAVGMVWLIARELASEDVSSAVGLPVVVLMDTYAPRGVYDEATVLRNRTNADVLSSELADLPAVLQKEAIGAIWERESQIVKQNPRFVVIHRSAFFHSMNQELGFGYPDQPEIFDATRWSRLYDIADNKLIAFLGYVAESVPDVRFIVYSRGTGGGWPDPAYQQNWVRKAVSRFDKLEGRIDTFAVPGGVESGSFRNPEASDIVRKLLLAHLVPEN